MFSEIGVGLAGFGVSFVILGMILLFDKGLLAIGNVSKLLSCLLLFNQLRQNRFLFQILFIVGLTFVIGIERTLRFFFQMHKIKGTACFFGGILIVLLGWPIVGMIVELYGFVSLFG